MVARYTTMKAKHAAFKDSGYVRKINIKSFRAVTISTH